MVRYTAINMADPEDSAHPIRRRNRQLTVSDNHRWRHYVATRFNKLSWIQSWFFFIVSRSCKIRFSSYYLTYWRTCRFERQTDRQTDRPSGFKLDFRTTQRVSAILDIHYLHSPLKRSPSPLDVDLLNFDKFAGFRTTNQNYRDIG